MPRARTQIRAGFFQSDLWLILGYPTTCASVSSGGSFVPPVPPAASSSPAAIIKLRGADRTDFRLRFANFFGGSFRLADFFLAMLMMRLIDAGERVRVALG